MRIPKQPNNERKKNEPQLIVRTHRCGSWWCPHCARRKSFCLRKVLLERVGQWRVPAMITLTVDRSKWDSAEQVHDHVTSNSLVPRLMKRLGLELWVGVLEFQKETGEGWPHWHILCDWPGYVEFNEIRRLWWGLFGIGNIQVHVNKGKAGAVHYLCSYLNKITEATPAWLLARTKSVRRVSTSKAVGAVVREAMIEFRKANNGEESFEPETEKAVVVEQDQPTTKREKSALIWRISQCGTFSRVSKKHGGLEVPLGTLRCDSEAVAIAGKQGRIEIIRDNKSVVRIVSPSDPFMDEVWKQLEKWDAENHGYPKTVIVAIACDLTSHDSFAGRRFNSST